MKTHTLNHRIRLASMALVAGTGLAAGSMAHAQDQGTINLAYVEWSSEVASTGGWFAELTGIEPGIYDLRLDEIDESGVVKSRIVTPFKKESKDFLMNMVSGSITVQPGNSLWRIARRIFGRGIRYIEIYEKNNDLIRDPDLIYPGQVFSIPIKK